MSILRADSIRDRAGTGAPNFPNGATVTGVITATSFSGAVTGNVTGNVSGTSAGLTGTPSIIVQDATVQGDLTVNGTTSTIDTVITAVDSLNVEGNVGIGTDNPTQLLHLSKSSPFQILLERTGSNPSQIAIKNEGELLEISQNTDGIIFKTGSSPAERVRITAAGTAIFKAGLAEKFNNVGGPIDTNRNQPLTSGNVIIFTGTETGNVNINITGVHSVLASGESFSITAVISPNNVCIINTFDIDGVSQTIKWSGGSAPTAGASGRDVYTFTAVKTGTGTTDYEVFGAATNYA